MRKIFCKISKIKAFINLHTYAGKIQHSKITNVTVLSSVYGLRMKVIFNFKLEIDEAVRCLVHSLMSVSSSEL